MTITDQSQVSEPTEQELQEARALRIPTAAPGDLCDHYGRARKYVSHEQVLKFHRLGIDVDHCAAALEAGASFEQVLEIHRVIPAAAPTWAGSEVFLYALALEYVSHEEALEAYGLGIEPSTYAFAVRYVRHAELVDAVSHGVGRGEALEYARARRYVTREQVLEAKRLGINLEHYNYALWTGRSHTELLEAHEHGIEVLAYAELRYYRPFSHERALKHLTRP